MPSRRNAARNPSFEVDGNHWFTAQGGGGNVPGFTRTNNWAQNGVESALFNSFTCPPGGFTEILTTTTDQVAAPNQLWGGRAKINVLSRTGTTQVVASVCCWSATGVFLAQGLGTAITGLGVQDLISNSKLMPASTAFVSLAVAVSVPAGGTSGTMQFYIDSILLERVDLQPGFVWPTDYTYFDGSMAGFHWAGTAHASESVQDTSAAAAMSDSASMSGSVMRLQKATASLSGASSMAGTPLRVRPAASAMRADSVMSPVAGKITPVRAAFSDDTSIMLPSLAPVFVTSGAMSVGSSMNSSQAVSKHSAGHMSIESSASAAGNRHRMTSASMSADLSMEATAEERFITVTMLMIIRPLMQG